MILCTLVNSGRQQCERRHQQLKEDEQRNKRKYRSRSDIVVLGIRCFALIGVLGYSACTVGLLLSDITVGEQYNIIAGSSLPVWLPVIKRDVSMIEEDVHAVNIGDCDRKEKMNNKMKPVRPIMCSDSFREIEEENNCSLSISRGDTTTNSSKYLKSNTCNNSAAGKYFLLRQQVDTSYHNEVYDDERVALQDTIIDSLLSNETLIHAAANSTNNSQTCSTPTMPWIVFTAGVMGVGKTYTIDYLYKDLNVFPKDSFLIVDPDIIRQKLPEWDCLKQQSCSGYNPEQAGLKTQKESGLIAEILTERSLQLGKNVLVDGTLRNATWYQQYFERLKQSYPRLRIAIIHITAPTHVIYQRARSRANITGRIVPQHILEQTIAEVPVSVKILSNHVDFYVEIYNSGSFTPLVTSSNFFGGNGVFNTYDGNRSLSQQRQMTQIQQSYNVDDSGIKIVTDGITWDSFKNVWDQTCPPLRSYSSAS